jgi:hypothetical protein
MKFCVLTEAGDHHSHAVRWALEKKGHVCDLVYFGDLPQAACLTLRPDLPNGAVFESSGTRIDFHEYDAFWLRRPAQVILPETVHPSDTVIARTYWGCVLDSVLRSIAETAAFSVNPPVGSEVSRLKHYQLTVAHNSGLAIPRTLVTTSSTAARSFIDENESDGRLTIVKPVYSSMWDLKDGGVAALETTRVKASDVMDGELELAPCIFQAEVRKRSEVRLTVMGHSLFAANIDSQSVAGAEVDYRLAPDWKVFGCQAIEVPEKVQRSVFEFQRRCNLNFGTLDFIIDDAGEWIFLETNPLGQFLWVEDVNPDIPVLDAFVNFLESGDHDYRYPGPGADRIRLSDFQDQYEDVLAYLHSERLEHVQRGKMTAPDQRLSSRSEELNDA